MAPKRKSAEEIPLSKEAGPLGKERAPLSKERVLETAVILADRGGIDALTMRKLAQELGVEAMSLYHYYTKKDEILDGILDIVMGEIEIPSEEQDWKPALRRTAISAHQVLTSHSWACRLMFSAKALSGRLRYMNSILATLRQGGFSPQMTHHAYHALDSHIVGFTLWQVSFEFDVKDLPSLGAAFLRALPVDQYPYLAEHVEQHLDEAVETEEGEFEFGLDLILDGLERLRGIS